ncbi:MAG: alkaline phosphatase D family protein [Pseudomonadota bacterium]
MSNLSKLSKRSVLKAIAASSVFAPELQAFAQRGIFPKLLLGPMLGPPTPTTVSLWAMVNGVYDVVIEYADNDIFRNPRQTGPIRASEDNLYIIRPTISGLAPATDYWYRFIVNGRGQEGGHSLPMGRFRTAPILGSKTDFTVGYGSCANFGYDPVQPIWRAVSANMPDLFFNLGDNIYCDSLESFVFDFEYQRQRGVHTYQHIARNVPQFAIWDDHDFGLNDHDRTNPTKENALAAFKRYWMNPSYGLPDTPGVFFSYSYGAVDFIFTDGRYYRDPNKDEDTPEKTMLGKRQLEWLKDTLKASEGIFKVLACGSGWTKNKGPGGDAWSSFLYERDGLFNFIRDEGIEGVIFISGDTHIGEFNCIPWSEKGGYDFYDLVSSPISSRQSSNWLEREPEIRLRTPPYTIGPNVGFLNFDLAGEPSMTWWLSKPDGKPTWAPATFRQSQLKNGVSSWRSYMKA